MKNEKLIEQSKKVDKILHHIWFAIMFNRDDDYLKSAKKLSFIEMRVIGLAYENPDIILKEIREKIKVPQTTLSSIISKLEKIGIIKRVLNPRDMRSFSLEITKQGKKMMETHYKKDIETSEKILFTLEEDEREDFVKMLEKISVSFSVDK